MGLLLLLGSSGQPGLLDQYTAAVAFSLRRLESSATRAIRVRRSSDSAEQDIGFSGNNLDTASLLSFCGAGDGFVTTFYDQVGSNNAVQTTAGNQPQIVASGVLIVNEFNKPAIRSVDASTSAVGPHLAFDPWYVNTQQYVGLFTSYSMLTDGAFPSLVGGDPTDRGLIVLHNSSARNIRCFAIRTGSFGGNGTAFATNTTTVLHLSANRTSVLAYVNTTAAADINVADGNQNFNMPTKVYLLNTNVTTTVTSSQLMSEFIGFTADQSSNQLAIRTNIANYWRA